MSVFLFCRNNFTALAMISHGGGPETRHVMRFISFDNILHVRCVISVSCLCHITDITDITVYFFHVVNQLGHQLGQSFCIASCSAPSCRGQHDAKSDGHLRLNTTNTTPGNALKLQSSPVISNPSSKPAHSLNLTRVSRSNDSFKFSWVRWSDSEGMLMGMWAQCWKLEIEWMVNERLKWWNVVKRPCQTVCQSVCQLCDALCVAFVVNPAVRLLIGAWDAWPGGCSRWHGIWQRQRCKTDLSGNKKTCWINMLICIYIYIYIYIHDRRKFSSQTSDNMDRWKAEQGRGREKRKIRRKKSRRERVRRKQMQMREKVGKSRNTVFFQWFVAPEGRRVGSLKRRVRSQLARWEMKNCTPLWREARLQVKCTKHTSFGPLLLVEMSKKCTPLWREAYF